MILQLNPSIPMHTSKGPGEALLVIDYSPEFDLIWVVALDDGGAIWCLKNSEVRAFKNETLGRKTDS